MGSVLGVGEAVANVQLFVLAAFPISALGRVRALSVSYEDEGQLAQRQMQIMSRLKKGSTVKLVDALGYTVRLDGTTQARLITPNGTQYVVCEADASCSSVTASNNDLQLYEEVALDMLENETATAAEDETGRRLDARAYARFLCTSGSFLLRSGVTLPLFSSPPPPSPSPPPAPPPPSPPPDEQAAEALNEMTAMCEEWNEVMGLQTTYDCYYDGWTRVCTEKHVSYCCKLFNFGC